MNEMVSGATDFNGDVTSWDVSNIHNFTQLFYYAAWFNQDLCGWKGAFSHAIVDDIFWGSGCTFPFDPEGRRGTYCAVASCSPVDTSTVMSEASANLPASNG